MTRIARSLMGIFILAGAISLAACDKPDEAASPGGSTVPGSTQTGSAGTTADQSQTQTGTTAAP
ncbi:MAG: hypothetical protein ACREEE_00330 [Dongiaceae bacterium]